MARIRATRLRGTTRVTIAGRLSAGDLRRLEHACREALTDHPLRLLVDLTRTTAIDASAAAFVGRLRSRGAELHAAFGHAAFGGNGADINRRRVR